MAGKLTLTVSQLNEYVRRVLQQDPMLARIDLRGEISNLKFHQSGMLFFTLKDDLASIACAMSAEYVDAMQTEPFEGMQAVISGSVGLYARAGRYQFYAQELHPQGMGVLYERLLALKEKLSAEGLFAAERKRPIPCYPETVGVVSSPTGAVIHDILQVSLRRNPQSRILLCPARVQGVGAADEVIRAIKTLERMDGVDVIILARGGGSLEDLWTFNDERVVRAVAMCTKPVISAIGHETDVTLCDLAADLRAPTPSAAAECASVRREEIVSHLDSARSMLLAQMRERLGWESASLAAQRSRLQAQRPDMRLARESARLKQMDSSLRHTIQRTIESRSSTLEQHKRALELLNPYGVLERGYAIVVKDGVPMDGADRLAVGDDIAIKMRDGSIRSHVTEIVLKEKKA